MTDDELRAAGWDVLPEHYIAGETVPSTARHPRFIQRLPRRDAEAIESYKNAAVAQARREALEAAAKIADAEISPDSLGLGGWSDGAETIAAKIRLLAEEKTDG